MASLVGRFNLVAMTKAVPLETIEMDKKYPLIMVSNDEDRREARVVLLLILGDNTLGRLYMPPEFTPVFTLSDIWNINNDRVKYVLNVVHRRRTPKEPEARISQTRVVWVVKNKWSVF